MKVFLIAAISIDGFIAQHTNQSPTEWNSAEDKAFFRETTQKMGVMVMGSATFSTIGFPLPKRLNVVYSSKSKAEFEHQFNLTPDQTSADKLRVTTLEPRALCEQLATEGFDQIALCGGSSIYTQFMQANMVDKILLTVEPVIFGQGVKLFSQAIKTTLKLVSSKQLNETGTLLLEYDCKK